MTCLTGAGLQVLAASPSDLDLCAVHVVAHASDGGHVASLTRALQGGEELVELRAKGYVATASARGAGIVASAIAPAHAAREVAASLSRAIAEGGDRVAGVPSVTDVAGAALAEVLGGDVAGVPAVSLRNAPRSVVLVAPQAALPSADDIRPLTVGGVDETRYRTPPPLDGPVVFEVPDAGRAALEVISVLGPALDARAALARSLVSTALAGHHSGLVTTAVDAALDGGYDVTSMLDVVAGVDVLRVTVGVRDAALLPDAYRCVALVLAGAASRLREPGVLDGARAHVAAAYEASHGSLVALAEGITSFVAQGLSVQDFERATELIAAIPDDDIIRIGADLTPEQRIVVVHGATERTGEAVRALVTQTPGGIA